MNLAQRTLLSRMLLPFCLAVGAALSVFLGQDANFDLKNYHIYNAWALLHDRSAHDFGAAGSQSFFNPLPDLPYYALGTGVLNGWPIVLAAFQGLWYGLLLFILCKIAIALTKLQGRSPGWPDLLAVAVGASGTMAVSQAGSTTNEILLACLVLLGLLQLLPLYGADLASKARSACVAGICCGLAAGLKPTAVIYIPAMALSLLVTLRPRGDALRLALIYTTGSVLAFLVSYGWWGWHLYRLTGNPSFPYFNQLFRSDWIGTVSGTDPRFRPRDLAQWLFYPFYWAKKNSGLVTELEFADPRYALAMLAVMITATLDVFQSARSCKNIHGSPSGLLSTFAVVAYVAWLGLFSILRYAVPIEALTGLLMLSAVRTVICSLPSDSREDRRAGLAMLVILLVTAGCTRYPDWGHVSFSKTMFKINPIEVEPGSMVLLVSGAEAYVVPFFAHTENIDFIGLSLSRFDSTVAGYRYSELRQQYVTQHKGPLYALRRADPDNGKKILDAYLPDHRLANCRPISSNLEIERDGTAALQICAVEKTP